jgi:hypothetical protein
MFPRLGPLVIAREISAIMSPAWAATKLYLNLNPAILEMFKKDMDGNIAKAAKNWPGLVEKIAK